LIVGAVGRYHYPIYPGNYSVQVGKDDCISEMSDKYYVEVVGVEYNEQQIDYLIPNPASEYIEITINGLRFNPSIDNIHIFDVLGIEQSTQNLTPTLSEGEGVVRIDVSHLAPGVYFVRVGDVVRKFVKL
jgi:hypothetical protein